jgi:hypothetical protein
MTHDLDYTRLSPPGKKVAGEIGDLYECANQLEGYVGPNTPAELAAFLLREGKAAATLADEVVRLRAALSAARLPASPGEPDWKRAFSAQSRKLEAVLHIPGVREALAELHWPEAPAAAVEQPVGVVTALTFEQKSVINRRFQELYDAGMQSGKHGHYETMFVAMHQAYAEAAPSPPGDAS